MNRSRLRGCVERILLMAAGTLAALLIAEAGLRIAGFSRPYFYTYHDRWGWALQPGVEGWQTQEGRAYVRINSHGFRDREHSVAKPPRTFRIAVIGDSFSDAYQVPLEKAYWHVMERELNRCGAVPGKTVEVLNFGIRGFSTAQELLVLRDAVWKFKPDMVLLQFYPENDMVESSPALNTKADLTPFFRLQDGKLVLDTSFADRRIMGVNRGSLFRLYFGMRRRVRLMQAIDPDRVYRSLRNRMRATRTNKPEDRFQGLVLFKEGYAPPRNPERQQDWLVTEALILAMRDETRAHGARFAVLLTGTPVQAFPDNELRSAFARSVGMPDLFYSNKRVATLCRAREIPVIDLGPEFQKYADRTQMYLHSFDNTKPGHGHWNALGHGLAGRIAAKRFCGSLAHGRK